ncbi:MAG TPA: PilX N-terminal domain-containing pilus assembly protein [Gammaproteobacteria bacterium]|nr:PilX N-terminal domain-containing pilus assembly protein [Gammaproteobacteria bacterium]
MNEAGCAAQASLRRRERGAALVTALIFLIIISVLSISSMRAGSLGVRMAQNEEARLSAVQVAQALTEAIVGTPAATPVIGGAGFSNCTAGEPGCSINNVVPPAGWLANEVAAGHLSARVERLSPPDKPPPRAIATSIDKFSAASFQLIANYDRSDEGLGSVELTEGLLVLVPRE